MSDPVVDFTTNIDLDKHVCVDFLKLKKGGIDFGKTIVSNHPQLKGVSDRATIYHYVTDYYESQLKNIVKEQLDLSRSWREAEEVFFKNVSKLFRSDSWQFNKYACYLSMFNCNPRFLHNGTFQVYYKKESKIGTVMHELMHFKFYDFVKSEIAPKHGIIPNQNLWELSEVFNTIVLNLPQFQALSKKKEVGYPELKKKTVELERIYHQSTDMSDFLHKAL